MQKIVVVISGSGSNLQAIIDACSSGQINAEISAVISNVPGVYGLERAKKSSITSIELNHKNYGSRQEYDKHLAEKIDLYKPDLIVLAGFMRILTPEFVQHYQGKLLNIHPSLLPKYQGLHTHKRALESGDKEHGATVHFVSAELDGGPPIIQGSVPILETDDEQKLAQRVQTEVEHYIYPLAVQWCIEKKVQLTKKGVLLDSDLLPTSGFQYKTKFN